MSTNMRDPAPAATAERANRWSDLGTNMAKGWERHLVPRFRPWAQRLVDAGRPAPGQRVLDVACSTGLAARIAADAVGESGQVSGLDNAPGMIEVARSVCSGIKPSMTWHVGDAHALPFQDAEFDLVVTNQGLHFFGDPVGALREMHRVLAEGGRLALGLWCPIERQHGFRRLVEALEEHLSPQARGLRCVACPWGREELRDMATEAGFDDVHIDIDTDTMRFESVEECLYAQASSTPLGVAVSAVDASSREKVVHQVEAALDDLLDEDGLPLVFDAYLLTAHR